MIHAWIFSTMTMDSNYDGILDPLTMKTDNRLYLDFNEAIEICRSFISDKVDIGKDVKNFSNHCALSDDEEEDYDGSTIENAKDVIDILLPNILCGKAAELPEKIAFDYISDKGADVKYECSDAGERVLSITGGWKYQPILMTNCFDMTNPELKYYFRMENWFGENHIICSAELTPTIV